MNKIKKVNNNINKMADIFHLLCLNFCFIIAFKIKILNVMMIYLIIVIIINQNKCLFNCNFKLIKTYKN